MTSPRTFLTLRAEYLSWTQAATEVVALDLRSSRYLATNQSGKLLWPLLEKGCTEAALVAALVKEYEVPESVATHDVAAYVEQLRASDLISERETTEEYRT